MKRRSFKAPGPYHMAKGSKRAPRPISARLPQVVWHAATATSINLVRHQAAERVRVALQALLYDVVMRCIVVIKREERKRRRA